MLFTKGLNPEDHPRTMFKVIEYGHLDMLKEFIKQGYNINQYKRVNNNLISKAAREGQSDILSYLITNNTDPYYIHKDEYDKQYRFTLLSSAIRKNNLAMIKFLRKNYTYSDNVNNIAVCTSASTGTPEMLNYFIEKNKKVISTDCFGQTLAQKAAEYGNLEQIKSLVAHQVDLNQKGKKKYTALMYAVKKQHIEVIKYLLKKDVKINEYSTNYNETALSIAAEAGNKEIVNLLLSHGAKIDTYVLNSALGNKLEFLFSMLSDNDPLLNKLTYSNVSLLVRAMHEDDIESFNIMLKKGADINIKDNQGSSPLTNALDYSGSFQKYLEIIFQTKSLDVNQINNDGEPPLYIAIKNLNFSSIKKLIELGADVNFKFDTSYGKNSTILIYAAASNFREERVIPVIEYLLQHGANLTEMNSAGLSASDYLQKNNITLPNI